LTKSDTPERFGVVEFDSDRINRIVEKPKNPPSNMIVTGLYVYDKSVFDIINGLSPSARGELEITDLNNRLDLNYSVVNGWYDVGEWDSLEKALRELA
jgi:glucose-1-phosphate thymidylyltransferase